MKTFLTLALLLGTVVMANAQDDEKGKGKGKGKLPDPETTFKKLDTNNDGKLSKEEYSKMRDSLPEKIKDKGGSKADQLFDKMFDMADENKDGSLSLDEFKKMREKLAERLKGKKGDKK